MNIPYLDLKMLDALMQEQNCLQFYARPELYALYSYRNASLLVQLLKLQHQ